jgi:hypothetical protein
MALQVGDNHVADGHNRRVAAGEGLNCDFSTAQEYPLDIESVLAEYSFVFSYPKLRLARTDRRIANAKFVGRLREGPGGPEPSQHRTRIVGWFLCRSDKSCTKLAIE